MFVNLTDSGEKRNCTLRVLDYSIDIKKHPSYTPARQRRCERKGYSSPGLYHVPGKRFYPDGDIANSSGHTVKAGHPDVVQTRMRRVYSRHGINIVTRIHPEGHKPDRASPARNDGFSVDKQVQMINRFKARRWYSEKENYLQYFVCIIFLLFDPCVFT